VSLASGAHLSITTLLTASKRWRNITVTGALSERSTTGLLLPPATRTGALSEQSTSGRLLPPASKTGALGAKHWKGTLT
jgi:hypothetical protein